MFRTLKYILFSPIDFISLMIGVLIFKKKNTNSFFAYKSMMRLYYIFGDIILDLINNLTREIILNQKNKKSEDEKKLEKINNQITDDGLFIYENFLSKEEICELKKLIKGYEFKLRLTDKYVNLSSSHHDSRSKFDPQNPKTVLYEFDPNDLINQKIIQKILLKNELIDISERYFRSRAFFDHVSLTITTNFNKKADSNAAQMYHFDLDRPKWLKFLIYVNDVDLSNGPHCYIKKTHKNYAIPYKMRSKGYIRFADNDEDLLNFKKNEIKIAAKAGTAIIEDTKGFHRGEVVKNGYRILLNIQINSSMYGCPYKKVKINKIHDDLINSFRSKKNFFEFTTNIKQLL
jgi:hypothetical protein